MGINRAFGNFSIAGARDCHGERSEAIPEAWGIDGGTGILPVILQQTGWKPVLPLTPRIQTHAPASPRDYGLHSKLMD